MPFGSPVYFWGRAQTCVPFAIHACW